MDFSDQPHTADSLLDWAETLLCNSMPIPSCNQLYWHEKFKAWRDAKNALPPQAPACSHSADLALPEPRPRHCPTCGAKMWDAGD